MIWNVRMKKKIRDTSWLLFYFPLSLMWQFVTSVSIPHVTPFNFCFECFIAKKCRALVFHLRFHVVYASENMLFPISERYWSFYMRTCYMLNRISNTQPAGHMWPTWCDCAACVIITNIKIWLKLHFYAKPNTFYPLLRPAETFFSTLAARELILCQNVALVEIWVWDPYARPYFKSYYLENNGANLHDFVLWHLYGRYPRDVRVSDSFKNFQF